MTKILKGGRRSGRVEAPSSKSIAHRELIAAALSGVEPPVIRGLSRDLDATRWCLKAMMSGESIWPCGESGTTLRLLEPIAGVMGWRGEFRCEGRLAERPRLPFEKKEKYVIPGQISSQFVSGLLMALPLVKGASEIAIDGELQSASYVRLTEDVLAAASIHVERTARGWSIPGGQRYQIAGGRTIEGDWTQAAAFLAMGVEVTGLRADSHQGDRVIGERLRQIDEGASTIDVSDTPDLYPVLSAYAEGRQRKIRFLGIERLRYKESNRLETTDAMIRAFRRGEPIDAARDHRIAMASAVLATFSARDIVLIGAECVEKSYPAFWSDFEGLRF